MVWHLLFILVKNQGYIWLFGRNDVPLSFNKSLMDDSLGSSIVKLKVG